MSQRRDWLECRACRCNSSDSSNLIDVFSSEFDFPSIIYKLTKIEVNLVQIQMNEENLQSIVNCHYFRADQQR